MIKQLSSREVYKNKWMTVREDDVEFADGSQGIYGIVEKPDCTTVIPRTKEGAYILVKPYRYSIGKYTWEFPCGSVEDKVLQSEELAAQELKEETGYTATTMTLLSTLHSAYGYSNQIMHVFLAEGLQAGDPQHEPGEHGMEIQAFSEKEVRDMILSGEITDSHSIAAWGLMKMKRSTENS